MEQCSKHSHEYLYPTGYIYGDSDRVEWLYRHEQYYDYAKCRTTSYDHHKQYKHNNLDLFSDEHQCNSGHGSWLSVEQCSKYSG